MEAELKNRGMEEDEREGGFCGRRLEEENIAVWEEAASEAGARGSVHAEAQGADGDFAVVADADGGAKAPEEAPPGAGWRRAELGTVLGEGLLVGGAGSGAEFAVDFVGVGVGEELLEEGVGGFEGEDVIGGEQGREAFWPVVVAALDPALGLGSGGVAQGDAVKVEGLAESFRQAPVRLRSGPEPVEWQDPEPAEGLGEGVRGVGEKEGMIIDVEGERETVGEEDAGEEIEVSQERLGRVQTGASVEAAGVVEDVEPFGPELMAEGEGLFLQLAGEPGMRRGVVLPERAEVAGLPAADGPGGLFVAGVRSEVLRDGPAADTGAVGLEMETAQEFAGDGAVGGAWRGGKQAGGERDGVRGPVWMMIAARSTRLPGVRRTESTGAQILGTQLVNPGAAEAEFERESGGAKPARAKLGEEMADQVRRQAARQLRFFIAPKMGEARRDGQSASAARRSARLGNSATPVGGCGLSHP